jgi:hypothetical protein
MQLQMAIPPEQDAMFAVALACSRATEADRTQAQSFADDISENALLPVVGAGASRPCAVPLASDLGWELVQAIETKRVKVTREPSDYTDFRGRREQGSDQPTDLGRVADLICMENPVAVVLDELGLRDESRWPGGEALSLQHTTHPHACAYRVLARLARERLISEALTFNFDCHFEGALIKEGFQTSGRRRGHALWPQRYDVVADARSNAHLIPRGDFVLNKVHGCVATLRRRYEEASGDPEKQRAADASIVIRWTQLLDWRGDLWARDLFRDRARRHVLVLIGFAGADPVIHSSLRAVLEEIRPDFGPQSRVRVIDARPNALALQLLADVGRGESGASPAKPLVVGDLGLPEVLFIVYVELLRIALEREAASRGGSTLLAADDPRETMIQLGVVAPALSRWTTALLQSTDAVTSGTGEAIDEYRDDLYVPLTGDAARSLLALRTERLLAERMNIRLTEANALLPMGFYRKGRDPRAFIATGLAPKELQRVAADGHLREVGQRLATPDDLIPVAAAVGDGDSLHFYSLPTGERVDL